MNCHISSDRSFLENLPGKSVILVYSKFQALQLYKSLSHLYKFGLLTADHALDCQAPNIITIPEIYRNWIINNPNGKIPVYNKNLYQTGSVDFRDVDLLVIHEAMDIFNYPRGSVIEECIIWTSPNVELLILTDNIENVYKPLESWMYSLQRLTNFTLKPSFAVTNHFFQVSNSPANRVNVYENKKLVSIDHETINRCLISEEICKDFILTGQGLVNYIRDKCLHDICSLMNRPLLFYCRGKKTCERLAEGSKAVNVNTIHDPSHVKYLFELYGVEYDYNNLIEKGVFWFHSGMSENFKELVFYLLKSRIINTLYATECFAYSFTEKLSPIIVFANMITPQRMKTSFEYLSMTKRVLDTSLINVAIFLPGMNNWGPNYDISCKVEYFKELINGFQESMKSKFIKTDKNRVLECINRGGVNTFINVFEHSLYFNTTESAKQYQHVYSEYYRFEEYLARQWMIENERLSTWARYCLNLGFRVDFNTLREILNSYVADVYDLGDKLLSLLFEQQTSTLEIKDKHREYARSFFKSLAIWSDRDMVKDLYYMMID